MRAPKGINLRISRLLNNYSDEMWQVKQDMESERVSISDGVDSIDMIQDKYVDEVRALFGIAPTDGVFGPSPAMEYFKALQKRKKT